MIHTDDMKEQGKNKIDWRAFFKEIYRAYHPKRDGRAQREYKRKLQEEVQKQEIEFAAKKNIQEKYQL